MAVGDDVVDGGAQPVLTAAVAVLVAGVVVWRAGTGLSRDADALAGSTPLGRALVGVVLLGVATSLPEIATTVTAGVLGNASLVTGNLMGGVALQVVVLAVADVVVSRRPLTMGVTSPAVPVQHVVVLLLLSLAIAGMTVGEPVAPFGVGLWPLLLAAVYAGGLVLVARGDDVTRWDVDSSPQDERRERDDTAPAAEEGDDGGQPERPPAWRIAGNALLILIAGWVLARSGDRLAQSDLLDATFVGAVLVAVATSLPELSTVTGSIRAGAPDMAVSNIVGTNGLEVALLLVGDVALREGPLLSYATPSDVFLAALAAVLTCLYLGGLLLRQHRSVARAGPDSLVVVVVYLAGLVVLWRT